MYEYTNIRLHYRPWGRLNSMQPFAFAQGDFYAAHKNQKRPFLRVARNTDIFGFFLGGPPPSLKLRRASYVFFGQPVVSGLRVV